MENNSSPQGIRAQDTVEISSQARLLAGAQLNPVSNPREGVAGAGVITNVTSLREGYPLEKESALESQETTRVVPPQVTGENSGREPVSPQAASISTNGGREGAAQALTTALEVARTTEIINNTYGVPQNETGWNHRKRDPVKDSVHRPTPGPGQRDAGFPKGSGQGNGKGYLIETRSDSFRPSGLRTMRAEV
jgi:hypothetical protein